MEVHALSVLVRSHSGPVGTGHECAEEDQDLSNEENLGIDGADADAAYCERDRFGLLQRIVARRLGRCPAQAETHGSPAPIASAGAGGLQARCNTGA